MPLFLSEHKALFRVKTYGNKNQSGSSLSNAFKSDMNNGKFKQFVIT